METGLSDQLNEDIVELELDPRFYVLRGNWRYLCARTDISSRKLISRTVDSN